MSLASGTSKVAIISQAFGLLGATRTTNDIIAETSDQVAFASQFYDTLLLGMLTEHDWRFTMIVAQLKQLKEKPSNDAYQFAYQFPLGFLSPLRIYPKGSRRTVIDYIIYEEQIWTDQDNILFIDYKANVGEARFPAYFVTAIITQLAAWLAMPVTQNIQVTQFWNQEAEKVFLQARRLDSQIQPNNFIQVNDIFASHFAL